MSKKLSLYLLALVWSVYLLLMMSMTVHAAPLLQVTSTWDPRTPPSTPTPYSVDVDNTDLNFSCPVDGVPVGYGTVQPDPAWLASCGHCLATPTSVYDGYVSSSELVTYSGSLSSGYDADGYAYMWGRGRSHPSSFDQLFQVDESIAISPLYFYIRFSGYSVLEFGNVEEGSYPVYFSIYIDDVLLYQEEVSSILAGDFSDYLVVPITNYEDITANVSHHIRFSISDDGGMVGDPDYMQDFGCSRFYILPFDDLTLDGFTCPIFVVGSSCSDVTATPVVSGLFQFVEMNVYCNSPLGGSECDKGGEITDDWVSSSELQNFNNLYFAARVDGVIPVGGYAQGMNVEITVKNVSGGTLQADDIFVYWSVFASTNRISDYSDALLSQDEDIPFSNVLVLDAEEVSDFGINWLDDTDRSYIFRVLIDDLSAPDGQVYYFAMSGVFSHVVDPDFDPDPVPDDCVDVSNDYIRDVVTGSYCSTVLPDGTVDDFEFDVFEQEPSVCISIPYISLIDFIPEWLLLLIAEDFISFLSSWAYFPASTVCYHLVNFTTYYFLNIPVTVGLFVNAGLVYFIARRLTSKAG